MNSSAQEKKRYSHWSISLNGGQSVFDGDVPQKRLDILPTSITEYTYSATLEYNITSIWGLYGRISHFNLTGNDANVDFKTPLNSIDFGGNVNILKLIFPFRSYRLKPYAYLGLGYSYYTSNYKPNSGNPVVLDGRAITVPVGFLLEYRLSRIFSLIANIQYRAFNKDNLEGDPRYNYKGVTNDFVGSAQIGVRLKFGSKKHPPMRDRIEPNYVQVFRDSVKNMYRQLSSVQKEQKDLLAKVVENSRKNQCNCKPDSTYTNLADTFPTDSIPNIYFDFDKTNLSIEAHEIIRKVANTLILNPESRIEITGFCDEPGTKRYNLILSNNRVKVITIELIKHGIASKRIKYSGKGKLENPPHKYRPNRRCEIRFIK